MRILSQDGMIDLPYESVGVSINHSDDCMIIAYQLSSFEPHDFWKIARYSTKEKARKAMELLQDSYVANELFKIMDKEQKALLCMAVSNVEEQQVYGVFCFPKDDAI